MRLVDADAFFKDFPELMDYEWASQEYEVDAEPVKHGHWISVSQTKFEKLFFHSRVFKCSICGNYLDFDGVNFGRGDRNYCPNCGAKMEDTNG